MDDSSINFYKLEEYLQFIYVWGCSNKLDSNFNKWMKALSVNQDKIIYYLDFIWN